MSFPKGKCLLPERSYTIRIAHLPRCIPLCIIIVHSHPWNRLLRSEPGVWCVIPLRNDQVSKMLAFGDALSYLHWCSGIISSFLLNTFEDIRHIRIIRMFSTFFKMPKFDDRMDKSNWRKIYNSGKYISYAFQYDWVATSLYSIIPHEGGILIIPNSSPW